MNRNTLFFLQRCRSYVRHIQEQVLESDRGGSHTISPTSFLCSSRTQNATTVGKSEDAKFWRWKNEAVGLVKDRGRTRFISKYFEHVWERATVKESSRKNFKTFALDYHELAVKTCKSFGRCRCNRFCTVLQEGFIYFTQLYQIRLSNKWKTALNSKILINLERR